MSFKVAVFASVLLLSGQAFAESCDALSHKLVEIDKSVEEARIGGIGDNSAPRETNRLLLIGNLLQRKQYIFNVMQAQKCPVPKVVEFSFLTAAADCRMAMLGDRDGFAKEEVKRKCDKALWQPDQK